MGRALYLHIGTTKTGSTAIQNTISQRRRDLEQCGIYVQNRPAKASHSLLPACVLNDLSAASGRGHPMWGGVAPQTRLERFRREFTHELEHLPDWAESCVISSEHLSNWLQQDDEVDRLAAWLRPHFDRVTVIVYLRRQDQHVGSGYNEFLKSGIIPNTNLPKPAEMRALDYAALLARYAKAFGRSAVMPRIFERDSLLNRNVVDDFLHAIGAEIGTDEPSASNQSINLVGQDLLMRAIRRLAGHASTGSLNTMPEWRLITQAVESQCRGAGWQLAARDAQAFMRLFEESNEAVRSAYFPDRKDLFGNSYADAPAETPTQDACADGSIDVIFRLAQLHCEREAQSAMVQYRLLAKLDDQAGMRDALRQVLRHAPNDITARLRMAELMLADGRTAESLDHLDAVLRLDPQNKEARRRKGLLKQGRDGQPPPKTLRRPSRLSAP